MRHEGARAWKALNDAFTKGKVPTGELADAALILVGGVLLMLPGFHHRHLRVSVPAALHPAARPQDDRLLRGPTDQPTGYSSDAGATDRDNLIEGETVESPQPPRRWPREPVIIAGEIEEPSPSGRPRGTLLAG